MSERHGWDKARISANAILLMQQLEFMFSMANGDPFAKHVAPPSGFNPYYEEGDSWTEELAFSNEEFSNAFRLLGKTYTSKGQWDAAVNAYNGGHGDCPFDGQMYAAYNDRGGRVMVWLRNHTVMDEMIDVMVDLASRRKPPAKPPKPPGSLKARMPVYRDQDDQPLETGKPNLPETGKAGLQKPGNPVVLFLVMRRVLRVIGA
jgi:hypothetical protein